MASDYFRVTDTATRLRSVGHSLGLVVAAFLVGIVLSVFAAQFLYLGGILEPGAEMANISPLANVVLTAAQFVGFGIVVYVYMTRYAETRLFRIGLPSLRDVVMTVAGFVALYVLSQALALILIAFDIEQATNAVITAGRENPVLFLYMMGVTAVFVAPAEELLFRGVVQGLFRRAYGVIPGVLLASALFGVGHYFALSGGGKVTYLASAALLGIVLGAAYELTENLTVPIVIHALYNMTIFGVQYLVATGAVGA
jgi:hypothetical protein